MSPLDPRERDLAKCEDMRIYAEHARAFLGSRSLAEFLSNELVQAAVIRCVEVIGEAARQVSDNTRPFFTHPVSTRNRPPRNT